MPRKKKKDELEVDVKTSGKKKKKGDDEFEEEEKRPVKKLQKYEVYFEENAPEDVDDINTICGMAVKDIYETIGTRMVNEKQGLDQRIIACMFSVTFDAILVKLKKLEDRFPSVEIDVAGRFAIGYNTCEDENDEKEGNFMIYIRDLHHTSKTELVDSPEASSKERCVEWLANNLINENTNILREIAIDAKERMAKTLDLNLSSEEFVLPIFIMTYEALVKYITSRRRENDAMSYRINFVSCFEIECEEAEDGMDNISIHPDINSKLFLKDDEKASSKY